MITCPKCRGSGAESYRVHGVWPDGEQAVEAIKCEECDGFGSVAQINPVFARIRAQEMVLAPREPTPEMIEAAVAAGYASSHARRTYIAMIGCASLAAQRRPLDAPYLKALIDRLLRQPSSMTEQDLRKLMAEAAEMLHLLGSR